LKGFYLFLLITAYAAVTGAQSLPYNPLFDETKVNSIFINIDEDSLLQLYTDVESNHEYDVQFVYDQSGIRDTLEHVGFRLRGNTSRYSAKKSFKVSFNTFDPGRKYEGYEKLNLNGSHNDPSMVREKLFYDVWNRFGLAARRSSFIRVYINELYYGLYTNIEEMDEVWCKDRFGDASGNLYKCTYPADLVYLGANQENYKYQGGTTSGGRAYDLQNNESSDDYTDLVNLITILKQTSGIDIPCELEKVFNVDAFLKSYAMDVASGNWDDYAFNKNNFYLYHNPFTDQIEFIAYDCDNTFGVDWIGIDWTTRSVYSWANAAERPLISRILEIEEYNDRFSFYLNELVTTVLDPVNIAPHIDSMKNLITEAALEDEFKSYDYGYSDQDFLDAFNTNDIDGHTPYGVNNFIAARRASALDELVLNNIAPVLANEDHQPLLPEPGEDISIAVNAIDDIAIATVTLYYSLDSVQFSSVLLYDDGLHNDGAANDNFYGIELPAVTSNGYIYYHFQAIDNGGQFTRFPVCDEFRLKIGFEPPPLFINELLASNSTVIGDDFGEFEDYVEIYNAGSIPFYLGDKYISDDFLNPSKWRLPAVTLNGDSYLLIWTDNDAEQGFNHADFSLNASGEQLGLFASASEYFAAIDTLTFGQQTTDVSIGRLPNGEGPFITLPGPTPGFSNYAVAIEETNVGVSSMLIFSEPYSETLLVQLLFNVSVDRLALQLLSIEGKIIDDKHSIALQPGTHTISMSTQNIPAGLYICKAVFNDTVIVKKFILQ
jgi:spore coat protein H